MMTIRKQVVVCILALCLAISGVAQADNKSQVIKQSAGIFTGSGIGQFFRKNKVLIGVVIGLCFGNIACDKPERLPPTEERSQVDSARKIAPTLEEPSLVASPDEGIWLAADGSKDGDWSSGVFNEPILSQYDYIPMKIHDEEGKIIPSALRSGWNILYKDGIYLEWADVDYVDGNSVVLDYPYKAIDADQVIGVRIRYDETYEDKNVMFAALNATKLYFDDVNNGPTDDIVSRLYYTGKAINLYTNSEVYVRTRQDIVYYIPEGESEPVPVLKRLAVLQEQYPAKKIELPTRGYVNKDNLIVIED